MADVFISYNREDRDRAQAIMQGLEAEGFSVWWDAALRAGETYDEVTEQNLRRAGAVVVLWSKKSANSKWVRAEATVGERSSTLVPALIEDCERPIRFELIQTADLRHWRGDRNDPHWRGFLQDVRAAVARRSARAQPAPSSAQSASEASIETTFWNSIKDGTDRSDFEAYLKRYPNGHFATLAKNRIAAMSRAAPATPAAKPRPAAATPGKAAQGAARKSGNGLLYGGLAAGLAVIGAVAFLLTRDGADADRLADATSAAAAPQVVAEASPDAGEVPMAVDDAIESAATIETVGEVASEEGATLAAIDLAGETASDDATAEPDPAAPGSTFRDCESCPLMTIVPAGVFAMGSPAGEAGRNAYEGPQRDVAIRRFAIGVHEVTGTEWDACVAEGACARRNTSHAGDRPALGISWNDASAYAAWLTKKTGRRYRLPTEAEWEYAARGGTTSAYWWGERFDRARVATREPAAVGQYGANAFGLFDVLGNAREWVADCYVNNYRNAPTDGSAVTDGDCSLRVIRGGAWSSSPSDMRVANRSRINAGQSAQYMGVRLAADIE